MDADSAAVVCWSSVVFLRHMNVIYADENTNTCIHLLVKLKHTLEAACFFVATFINPEADLEDLSTCSCSELFFFFL